MKLGKCMMEEEVGAGAAEAGREGDLGPHRAGLNLEN